MFIFLFTFTFVRQSYCQCFVAHQLDGARTDTPGYEGTNDLSLDEQIAVRWLRVTDAGICVCVYLHVCVCVCVSE